MSWFDETTYWFDESSYSCDSGSASDDDCSGYGWGSVIALGAESGTLGGLSSTSGDQSGSNPAVTAGESSTESVETLTRLYGGNIQGATTGVVAAGVVGGGLTSTTGGIETTTPGPDTVIWFKNDVPYSRVEKRAEEVYAVLHGEKKYTPSFPVVIAETKESMETARSFFGGELAVVADRLELVERLLREAENNDGIIS